MGNPMLSFIKRRLTYANAAMTAALVFAMAGGAVAATGSGPAASAAKHKHHGSHAARHKGQNTKKGKKGNKYVITSTKQIKPNVLKALTGAPGAQGSMGAVGPAGPTGPQGAPGAAGKNGTNGTSGTNGKDGTSVTSASFSGNENGCEAGGLAVTSASGTDYVCNGKQGAIGQQGAPGESANTPLKAGETETGQWSVDISGAKLGTGYVGGAPITFARPLTTKIALSKVKFIPEKELGKLDATECPAPSMTEPEAAPGYLCIYTETSLPTKSEGFKYFTAYDDTTNGTTLLFENKEYENEEELNPTTEPGVKTKVKHPAEPVGFATGTWAVSEEG